MHEDGGVRLRPWTPRDAQQLVEALGDEEIHRWTPLLQPRTVEQAQEWIEKRLTQALTDEQEHFAVVRVGDEALVGGVNFFFHDPRRAELGYFVAASSRGNGYASAAARLAGEWAFANGVERLEALIHPLNAASAAVARRACFHREGLLHGYRLFRGEPQDLYMYARLRARQDSQ